MGDRGAGRGLRGGTDFFERLVGLSFFGGDDRSGVVVVLVLLELRKLLELLALDAELDVDVAMDGFAAVVAGALVVLVALTVLALTGDVTVVSCVLVVTVVVMVVLRGLVPGKDMRAPFIEKCCATRWVTPVIQQFC